MPGYVGLQLAVELTNILPSGSDIVVEEDLADVLGRGRVSRDMEKAFKDVVKISKFTPLYTSRDGSTPEVELHSGPGPTVLRAFQDSRYFTTVLTLSMLGYYHDRVSLAMKLSAVMDRRSEANIEGARPSPGFEGISATIDSCSNQTSAFQWATLGFAAFLEKIPENPLRRSPATQMIETMGSMSTIMLMFSHVSEIGGCANVPLVMTDDYPLRNLDNVCDTTSELPFVLEPQDVFYGIASLLDLDSSDPGESESYNQSKHNRSCISVAERL
ncbi:hypothetical protein F5X68DRAFT_255330 [Plectosphaerella plurivora]|uniref:Uncharacterized protein n=1 Tax=Plectosphaerella plurivora TaxID=936078 RepID=A0A9P8VF47_9PEZI|nr:hypothetical protein F5X68DRAFT_255330 [Plectosphaerella plurivora]